MTVDCRHVNVFGWRVDRTGRFSLPQRSDEAAGCEIDGRGKAPMEPAKFVSLARVAITRGV